MNKNISAWTGATMDGLLVPYISINREGVNNDLVSITIRGRSDPSAPKHAEIKMCREEFALLLIEALKNA